MKYKLHTGIKAVIEAQGKEVLKSVLLSNILADYGAYDDYPTTKIVLKDALSKGYGRKILESSNEDSISIKNAVDKSRNDFEKGTNYKKDVVAYVFDSISFGLGAISDVTEPLTNGFDPFASEYDGILDRLPDMLKELKSEYSNLLEELLVKPKDLVWDAPAYYTASSENKLFLIEGKIAVINKQLGISDNWCEKQKALKLSVFEKRKQGAVQELLDSKKIEYSDLITKSFITPTLSASGQSVCFDQSKTESIKELENTIIALYKEKSAKYDGWCQAQKNKLIHSALDKERASYSDLLEKALIVPTSKFISRSAYFDKKYAQEISDKERLINAMCAEMGKTLIDWCNIEKRDVLQPFVVSRQKQLIQAFFKIALPLIILIYMSYQIVNYVSSTDEIKSFEETIAMGDKYLAEGEYGQSISAYLAAGENYDGAYKTSSYKSEAIDKADNCFEQLKSKIEFNQFEDKEYRLIKDELSSLPQEYLESDETKMAWVARMQEKLIQSVNSEIETLINRISACDGSLDAEGQSFLDELLYVSPDNYWFNFVKNKK